MVIYDGFDFYNNYLKNTKFNLVTFQQRPSVSF